MPERPAWTASKVMVIDDSNTIRRSAEIFLCRLAVRSSWPKTASRRWQNSRPPSGCHFVDIAIPRLDGYLTCADQEEPQIQIDAGRDVVVKDGLFDHARGRMVGSDQYLTKPFTKESLNDFGGGGVCPSRTVPLG